MDKKFTVGVIRVLTSDDPEFVGMHGRFIEEHYPGIRCVSKCIPDQPEGIHSHEPVSYTHLASDRSLPHRMWFSAFRSQ